MSDDISSCLQAIESSLLRLDRRVVLDHLQPGLDSASVRSCLSGAELRSTPEFEHLYRWRNGTSTAGVTLGEIWMLPGFYFLSLEDSIAHYEAFISDARWRLGWFPLFADGGGDFIILDQSSSGACPIRRFRLDETDHPVEYESLGAFLQTVAAAFHRQVFFLDEENYLQMEDDAFGALAAELNPDVDWWTT